MIFQNLITPIIPTSNSEKRLRFSKHNTEYIIPPNYQFNRSSPTSIQQQQSIGKNSVNFINLNSVKSQLTPSFWNEFQRATHKNLTSSAKSLITQQQKYPIQQQLQQIQQQKKIANLKRININNAEFNTHSKILKETTKNENPQIIANKLKDEYAKYFNSN
jgi:hypothetical protein